MADQQVVVELRAETKNLEKGFKRAEKTTDKFNKKLSQGLKKAAVAGAAVAAGVAAIGAGLVKLYKGFADAGAQLEKYSVTLRQLYGDAEKAKDTLDWLMKFQIVTPYDPKELMAAAVNLKKFGLDAKEYLTLVGDAAATMGYDVGETAQAFGKAMAIGAAGADMLRERFGINMEMLAEVSGKTVDQLKGNMGEFREALVAFMSQEKFVGGMERLAGTFQGVLSSLGGVWTDFQMKVGTQINKIMKEDFGKLLEWLIKLSESGQLQEWADRMADAFKVFWDALGGAKGIQPLLETLFGKVLPSLAKTIGGVLGKGLNLLIELLGQILPPLTDILDSVLTPTMEIINELMKLVKPLLDAVFSALNQILEPLMRPLVKIIQIIVKILEPFFKLLEPILKVALAPIVASLERSAIFLDILMTILEPIMAIVTPFVDILGTIYDIGGDLIKTVMQPVINLLTRISDKLKVFVDKIMPKFTHIVTTVKSVIEDTIIVVRDKLMGFINWVIDKINLLGFKLKTVKAKIEEEKPEAVIEREEALNKIAERRVDIQKKLKDLQTPILQEALERNAEFQERLTEAERQRVALKEEDLELSKKQLALLSDVETVTEKDKDKEKEKDKAVVDKGDEDIIRVGLYAGWNVMDAIADAEQKQADIAALEEKYLGRTKAFWEDWILTDEDKAKFEQGLQVTEARMEAWAGNIQQVLRRLGSVFSKFWDTLFQPFLARMNEAQTAWGKFGAFIVGSILDLVKQIAAKILVGGLITAAVIAVLNALVPGANIGTGLFRLLTGMTGAEAEAALSGGFGGILKALLGFEAGIKGVEGSKQVGGEIEKTGLYRLHKNEWVIPKRLTEVLGSLVGLSPQGVTARSLEERFNAFSSRLTQGIRGIMQPAIAGGQPPIHVHISGGLDKFIEGVEVSSSDEKQRLGRVVRIATAKDKEAD